MGLSTKLQEIIGAVVQLALRNRHEYATPEHFLYVLCSLTAFAESYEACDGDVQVLKEALWHFIETQYETISVSREKQTIEFSHDLTTMLEYAAFQAHSSGRSEIGVLHAFHGLLQLTECYALYYLTLQGVEPDALFLEFHDRMAEDAEGIEQTPKKEGESADKEWKRYATCLNEEVLKEDMVPLIGRENELKQMMLVLCRKEKNNPLLIGEAGVGKTALAYGLVRRIVEGEVPDALKGARVYAVDMGSMVAGTQYRGDFEKRIDTVLKGIAGEERPVIYLDEIHNIVGAGAVGSGTLDASNMLKPYMAAGHIRFIGSTTYEDYKKSFSKNHSLVRRFQNIHVDEPDEAETQRILEGLKPWYEAHHGVTYEDGLLAQIVRLSGRYMNDAFWPDKAIDLMDEAGAMCQLREGEERHLATEEILEAVLTEFLRIPKEHVASDEATRLRELPDRLKSQVFGQEPAIEALCRAIRLSRAGLNEEQKPVASLLFVGPTGVGKTEVARVLADTMNIPLVRFDMSEFMEKHAVAKFLGAPAGYVGYEEGGHLTDVIRKNPHCVLLLDEMEKAHPDIMNVLLQVMDYATVTDSQGVKADFRNVILIMTSNAGAADLIRTRMGFGGGELNTDAVEEAVRHLFTPEFRNRLTDIITFNGLSEDMAVRIVDKQLHRIEERLSDRGIAVSFSDALRAHIREEGLSAEYGARQLQRVIDHEIKPVLAERILDDHAADTGETLTVDWKEDRIVVI